MTRLLELRDHVLGRVDGHREADPDAAARAAAVARRDLRVDADHAPGGVEQRAARVAGVERGVGLDHVVDREAARRGQPPLQRRDDAGRQRALEPERVADRDRRVADLHRGGVAELERRQVEPLRVDAQQREVGVASLPSGCGGDGVPSENVTSIVGRGRDDVGVREDQARPRRSRSPSRSPRSAGRGAEHVERRRIRRAACARGRRRRPARRARRSRARPSPPPAAAPARSSRPWRRARPAASPRSRRCRTAPDRRAARRP